MEAVLERPPVRRRAQPRVETRNQAPEAQELEKLGLADLPADELPRLEVVVTNSKAEVIAHVESHILALIVSPLNRVLYLEAACSSDSGAHALMGAVSDARGRAEFHFYPPRENMKYTELLPPQAPSVCNVRLAVPGWNHALNHVAMLDRSGELMLAPDDETLWRKLREKMTCPTLEEWGKTLMPQIHASGLLQECEAFGAKTEYCAYVLAQDAAQQFDCIASRHVHRLGRLTCTMSEELVQKNVR
jgi:hypothetical protein